MTHCFKRFSRQIALGLLLAIGLQAVAAAVLSSSQTGSSGIPMVICTPTGMVVVSVDFEQENNDLPAFLKHSGSQCIFCAAHHAVPAVLVFALLFLLPRILLLTFPPQTEDVVLPDAPQWLRTPVRAPPSDL